MSPKDRLETIINKTRYGSIPVMPFLALGYTSKITGTPLINLYNDPSKCMKAQLLAAEMHGYEPFPDFAYAAMGPWEFGGEVKLPYEKRMAPEVIKRPIETVGDVDKLEVPDPRKAGSIPFMMEVAKLQAVSKCFVTFQVGSVFTWTCNIIGFENAMRWLIKEPRHVHKVLRKATDFSIAVAEYFVGKFGSEFCLPLELSTDSNDMISPKNFEEFVLPYIKEVHEKVLKMGVPRFFTHICGEQNRNLEHWRKLSFGEPGMISIGTQIDLDIVKNILGKDNIILGNVSTSSLMIGTFDEVFGISKKCIEKGKHIESGYILAPACEIPPDTPPINIYAMVKAAKELSTGQPQEPSAD